MNSDQKRGQVIQLSMDGEPMPQTPDNYRQFSTLLKIVETLRGPDGCPWDRQQTHKSLTRFAIEEAHELADAIESNNDEEIRDELGDVLLQVVLNAEIARQDKRFDIGDVIASIGKKMVRRHPHVFSDGDGKISESNWSKIKAKEKAKENKSICFALPNGLPALIGAHKIGEESKKWHFDWNQPEEVLAKVDEELAELKQALAAKNQSEIEHELGDLLFSLAQLARHLEVDAEQALRATNHRFESRFVRMQNLCRKDNKDFTTLNSKELETYWQQVKSQKSQQKQP